VKIGEAIGEVHSSTVALAKELRTAAEGHPSDHALYHVGRMLADRCQGTADTLEPFADRYGEPLNGSQGQGLLGSISTHIRREASSLKGRGDATGLLLLGDLRHLANEAHGAQIDWTILRQGASVARDEALRDAATVGQDEMRRVVQWLMTRIKESAPQILAG
jgi:hypothetical protein